MAFSKRYIDKNYDQLHFDPETLSTSIQEKFTEVVFAYLLGSAFPGNVQPYSDLDLAVYLEKKPDLSFYTELQQLCTQVVGPVRCDVGILNDADPVYRFEALKGHLLFTRDREKWLTFYSRTCREYEHQLYDYEKQRLYRLEYAD